MMVKLAFTVAGIFATGAFAKAPADKNMAASVADNVRVLMVFMALSRLGSYVELERRLALAVGTSSECSIHFGFSALAESLSVFGLKRETPAGGAGVLSLDSLGLQGIGGCPGEAGRNRDRLFRRGGGVDRKATGPGF
jgi:hypothetical protein